MHKLSEFSTTIILKRFLLKCLKTKNEEKNFLLNYYIFTWYVLTNVLDFFRLEMESIFQKVHLFLLSGNRLKFNNIYFLKNCVVLWSARWPALVHASDSQLRRKWLLLSASYLTPLNRPSVRPSVCPSIPRSVKITFGVFSNILPRFFHIKW